MYKCDSSASSKSFAQPKIKYSLTKHHHVEVHTPIRLITQHPSNSSEESNNYPQEERELDEEYEQIVKEER